MWSATWPREVQKLALEFCKEKPVHIVIGSNDFAVNFRIKQNIEVIDNTTKRFRITKLIESLMDGSKILVFTQTKRGADALASQLADSKFPAVSIHGDKSQPQRDYIMRQFKTGRTNILVATDLAARGLDVADIRYVINYDFPTHIEDYIHRVGRTGRAGREGVSYTFFTREDYKHATKLIDILEETEQSVPDELFRIARRPAPSRSSNNSYSQSKPPQKPSYPSYTVNGKSAPQQMHPPPTNLFVPQDPKSSQQPSQPPTQSQSQPQAPPSMNAYQQAGYYHPSQLEAMNPYPVTFNGYQSLDPQTTAAYHLNVMNYYNQMQAFFSLNNTLNQMDGKPADPSQQQAIQNLNGYVAQNAQNPQYQPNSK